MTQETRKVEFSGAGGERLAGALELPAGRPRAYALFAHCFSCSKDIRAAREISRALAREGFAVLRFDFTGLGSSEGDFANTNFSSNVDDLVSAADFLRADYAAPCLLIGHSLGGAAVIVAADRIPETKGVVTIGAPSSADHILTHIEEHVETIEQAGQATVDLGGRPFTLRRQLLEDLADQNVLEHAKRLKKPLLIMHAPRDQTVGIDNAAELFMAARHPKSFISLDRADHLISDPADAHFAAGMLAAWAERFTTSAETTRSDCGFNVPLASGDDARAVSIDGEDFAIALSVGDYRMVSDVSAAEGGRDLGPNPTRILEAALAACSAMTARMYARRKNWDLQSVEVRVRPDPDSDGHAPKFFEKRAEFSGGLDDAQISRLKEIISRCPVHGMLVSGVGIELVEED